MGGKGDAEIKESIQTGTDGSPWVSKECGEELHRALPDGVPGGHPGSGPSSKDDPARPLLQGTEVGNARMVTGEVEGQLTSLFPRKYRLGELYVPYTPSIGDTIAELVGQGMALTSVSSLPGMPSVYRIKQWKSEIPGFRDKLKIAYQARAEILADAALATADQSEWKTAKSDKIKLETAQWLAGAYDPETFGAKTKISGDPSAPLTFLIDTGIRREGDTGTPLEVKLDTSDLGKKNEKDPMPEKDAEPPGPKKGWGV